MLAVHSHLEDGAMGAAMIDAPLILVTALSTVSAGRANLERERQEKEIADAKAKAAAR